MELVDEVEEDDILVNLIDKEVHQWICPGKVWLDTEGKRIQAHGGSIFYEKDLFFDDKITTGKVKIPIGIVFIVSKDMK